MALQRQIGNRAVTNLLRAPTKAQPRVPGCAQSALPTEVQLQPVFFANPTYYAGADSENRKSDPPSVVGLPDFFPTGASWVGRFVVARDLWARVGVTLKASQPVTVYDKHLKNAGDFPAQLEEIRKSYSGPGVKVFLVNSDVAFIGGATTAGDKVVMSDKGSSQTLLAHEIGHVLGCDHLNGTVMEPSSSNSAENPRVVTMRNRREFTWPPKSAKPVCVTPDPDP